MKITNVPSLPGSTITLTEKQWKDFVKKSTFVVHTPPPPAPFKVNWLKLSVTIQMLVMSALMFVGFHPEMTFIPYAAALWMGLAWFYLVMAWIGRW